MSSFSRRLPNTRQAPVDSSGTPSRYGFPYPAAMQLLLTQVAADRFVERVRAVAPDAVLLRMQDDGTILGPDGPVARDDAGPEVAWGTADLFADGHPLGAFFGLLAHRDSVRWFQSPGAGTDHPVFALLAERGVRITTAHVNSIPIAEYVVRAVLDHLQRAGQWRAAQAASEWRSHEFREVFGTTWLVIGLGSIGREVAVRARAFGATVLGSRRSPQGDEPVDGIVAPDDVPGAVGRADVVVVCVPATSRTVGLVDDAFLEAMRPGSVLVNVGRGTLVDQDALHRALDRGVPEVALLDVVEPEPLPATSWLWSHPRVVLTPHNSAGGDGRFGRMADLFTDNLRRWRDGEPLRNEARPEALAGE